MFIRLVFLGSVLLSACTVHKNVTDTESGTIGIVHKGSNAAAGFDNQLFLEKRRLALIETGHPDSIMTCVAGEDSESVRNLVMMSVLYQADSLIRQWYRARKISYIANDSADPPSWTKIPDWIAFGEDGFYITGYGESVSEPMSSSQALMNARARIGRFFADSLAERLGVIDEEVYDVVSRFGAMIALYGTKESERWTDRSGSRKKSYTLIILNREAITENISINLANQLNRLYQKPKDEQLDMIRKGNFRDYQSVLRELYKRRIDFLKKSGKKEP